MVESMMPLRCREDEGKGGAGEYGYMRVVLVCSASTHKGATHNHALRQKYPPPPKSPTYTPPHTHAHMPTHPTTPTHT